MLSQEQRCRRGEEWIFREPSEKLVNELDTKKANALWDLGKHN